MNGETTGCVWWEGDCAFFEEDGSPGFGVYFFIGLAINVAVAAIVWCAANPQRRFNVVGSSTTEHKPLGPCAPAEEWEREGFWDSSDADIRDHVSKKAK